MELNQKSINQPLPGRVASVDFFRGLTMFLLAGGSTALFGHPLKVDCQVIKFLGTQLSHHEWHGLHFWDLIQPFFMFIVGVAIPFATANRMKKGQSGRTVFLHVLKRSFLLLLFGWSLSFISAGTLVFRFQNVLAQLSVTYLVAFLLMKKKFQVSAGLYINNSIADRPCLQVFPS